MHTLFIWKQSHFGLSETRHFVHSLNDLRSILDSELRGRQFYLEKRAAEAPEELLDYYVRASADDVTDDDFRWLTETVHDEVRGVRA